MLLALCLCCSALAFALAGAALSLGSAALLLFSRAPMGISKQTATTARAIVCDSTSPAERPSALAQLYACSALGYACGPLVGGVLTERGHQHYLAFGTAFGFATLAQAVWASLEETAPRPPMAAPPSTAPLYAWGRSMLWRSLLVCSLPEAALITHTTIAQPLLAQSLGCAPLQLGQLSAVQGLAAALVSLYPLPALFRRGILTERYALLVTNALVLVASTVLAWRPSIVAVWGCLLPLALAVSLQRAASVAIVSKATPAETQGNALGALDGVSSACRIVMPVLAGTLAARGEAHGCHTPRRPH